MILFVFFSVQHSIRFFLCSMSGKLSDILKLPLKNEARKNRANMGCLDGCSGVWDVGFWGWGWFWLALSINYAHKGKTLEEELGERGLSGGSFSGANDIHGKHSFQSYGTRLLCHLANQLTSCWSLSANNGEPFLFPGYAATSHAPLSFGPFFDPHPGGQWAAFSYRVPRYWFSLSFFMWHATGNRKNKQSNNQ